MLGKSGLNAQSTLLWLILPVACCAIAESCGVSDLNVHETAAAGSGGSSGSSLPGGGAGVSSPAGGSAGQSEGDSAIGTTSGVGGTNGIGGMSGVGGASSGSVDGGVADADAGRADPADAPPDVTPPCTTNQLLAIEPATANTGNTITLEGTFCGAATVNFPGGASAPATILGQHRATVTVPATATSGDLTVTVSGTPVGPASFRRASFGLGLQHFQQFDDQTNGPRQMSALVTGRRNVMSAVIGGSMYVLGGITGATTGLATVERATINADGSLRPFATVNGVTLSLPRYYSDSVVIGSYLYVVGGMTTGDVEQNSVERSAIAADGSLGAFSVVPGVTLARHSHRLTVVGNSLYAIGGYTGNSPAASVESATIHADGSLGPFTTVPGVALVNPRGDHNVMVVGPYVYVLGGQDATNPTLATVERAAINGSGSLGPFATVSGSPLLAARNGAAAVVMGSSLYVVGGVGGTGAAPVFLSSVEKAPIAADGSLGAFAVASETTLPTGVAYSATATTGNYFYAVGGQTSVATPSVSAVVSASIDGDGLLDTTAVATQQFIFQAHLNAQALIGNTYYAFGGTYLAGGDAIDQAIVGANGALGAFALSSSKLAVHLVRNTAAVIGNYVYMFAGASAAATPAITGVEQAMIQANGTVSSFTTLPTGLIMGRASHGTAVVGNYVYVVGGFYGSSATTIERAPINPDGTLGAFAVLNGVNLSTGHTDFNMAVLGKYLYVLGGENSGESAALTIVDRVALNADGTLNGNFSASNSFVNPRYYAQPAVIGGNLYMIGGDTGNTVERAAINSDGSLGTFALVPGLAAPAGAAIGFVAGNALTVCGSASCSQMGLP